MGLRCSKKPLPIHEKEELSKPLELTHPYSNDAQMPTAIMNSQNLDDFPENFRACNFKIPIVKQDIRLLYKFHRPIGSLKKRFSCFLINFLI